MLDILLVMRIYNTGAQRQRPGETGNGAAIDIGIVDVCVVSCVSIQTEAKRVVAYQSAGIDLIDNTSRRERALPTPATHSIALFDL